MKDPCIRSLLRVTELDHFYKDCDSKVVDELNLPVAKARIDIAVINGALHGYEIKSASDTLNRLPSQIEAYSKVFDYLSVVTEDRYKHKLVEILPKWIGVIVCYSKNGENHIKCIRKPKLNKNQVGFYVAKLLWKEELIQCLTEYQIPFKSKDRTWILCEILEKHLDKETLLKIVREKLKNRQNWKTEITKDCVIA